MSQTYRVAHRSFSVPCSDPRMLWLPVTPLEEPLLVGFDCGPGMNCMVGPGGLRWDNSSLEATPFATNKECGLKTRIIAGWEKCALQKQHRHMGKIIQQKDQVERPSSDRSRER